MDTRRYHELAKVLCAVALIGVALLILRANLFPSPLSRHSQVARKHLDDANGRVAGLVIAKRRGELSDDAICIVSGQSSVYRGIDPEVLAESDGLSCQYAVFWCSGGEMDQSYTMSQSLLDSDLAPRVVVLGIHPAFFSDRSSVRYERGTGDELWLSNMAQELHGFLGRAWIYDEWSAAMMGARRSVFRYWGDPVAAYAPSTAPMRPPELGAYAYRNHETNEYLAEQWSRFESYGWFDSSSYQTQDAYENRRLLSELTIQLVARGVAVIVVFMPERERIRVETPPALPGALIDELRARVPDPDLYVLDMRDSVADSLFADWVHLNDAGRAAFSIELGERIRALIASKKPVDVRRE